MTQEILLRGLGVLSTTIKLTGRPDLQTETKRRIRPELVPDQQTSSFVAAEMLFPLRWRPEMGLTAYRCLAFEQSHNGDASKDYRNVCELLIRKNINTT